MSVSAAHESEARRQRLLEAYDAQLRPAEVGMFPAGTTVERDGPVMRVVGSHAGFVASPQSIDLTDVELASLIERQRAFFASRGEALEWKTRGHDLPASIPSLLEAAGFAPEDTETVMACLAESCATEPPLPDGVQLVDVASRSDVEAVAAMESSIWDEDRSWLVSELGSRVADGSVSMVAAQADGRTVSAAWIVWVPGTEFAYLAGGGTVPAWRRRGVYRALVARRAREAVRREVRYLAVDASDTSRPVLERLGFESLTTTTPYVWAPSAPSASPPAAQSADPPMSAPDL